MNDYRRTSADRDGPNAFFDTRLVSLPLGGAGGAAGVVKELTAVLVCLRDIAAGEEILVDYGSNYW